MIFSGPAKPGAGRAPLMILKSAWFFEDGTIKITDIFYKMLWSNFLFGWYYLTYLSANRWYYGEVMEH